MRDRFNRYADGLTAAVGSMWAVPAAVLGVAGVALTGALLHVSDTWQVITTSTTIVTFCMVFVIQNSQNRDTKAVHLKLDEIIRSIETARNTFITLETAPEAVISAKAAELAELAERAEPSPDSDAV